MHSAIVVAPLAVLLLCLACTVHAQGSFCYGSGGTLTLGTGSLFCQGSAPPCFSTCLSNVKVSQSYNSFAVSPAAASVQGCSCGPFSAQGNTGDNCGSAVATVSNGEFSMHQSWNRLASNAVSLNVRLAVSGGSSANCTGFYSCSSNDSRDCVLIQNPNNNTPDPVDGEGSGRRTTIGVLCGLILTCTCISTLIGCVTLARTPSKDEIGAHVQMSDTVQMVTMVDQPAASVSLSHVVLRPRAPAAVVTMPAPAPVAYYPAQPQYAPQQPQYAPQQPAHYPPQPAPAHYAGSTVPQYAEPPPPYPQQQQQGRYNPQYGAGVPPPYR